MKTLRMALFALGLVAGQWGANCYAAGEPAGNENVLLLSGSDWTIHEDSAGTGLWRPFGKRRLGSFHRAGQYSGGP